MFNQEDKISIFEYLMYQLKNWYCESNEINDIDNFNIVNDLSILKVVKLHFLTISINSNNDRRLLDNHTFYAMPYGPVETDLYSRLKENDVFTFFSINNFKTSFDSNDYPNIRDEYKNLIDDAIKTLRTQKQNLINLDAGTLVDLTHLWSSWSLTYKKARAKNIYSMPISSDLIFNDNKILKTN